ncbi:bifunctional precorrin-2 dehydrogenase/sirohydrochlorin ferrochelatase [Calditrichota bacterium]
MYLPLWIKTEHLKCLVVGGGRVAFAKVRRLMQLGCQLSLISPEFIPEFNPIAGEKCHLIKRGYQQGDVNGFDLIIVATRNRELNKLIAEEASSLHIPVNVVDDPELCTVIFSANVQDRQLGIAVSTSGTAPFLAAAIRDRLAEITSGWGDWVDAGGKLRDLCRSSQIEEDEMHTILKKFSETDTSGVRELPNSQATLDEWKIWLEKNAG